MDDDYYFYIEDRIHEARRLRAEAAGELFAAGWQHLRRFVSHITHAVIAQLRSHHLLPH